MSHRQNGRRYILDLGPLELEMCYVADRTMTVCFIDGGGILPDGRTETVATTVAEISPGVYLTAWQRKRGMRLIHLEDFERGRVHLRILRPGSAPVIHLGTLTELTALTETEGIVANPGVCSAAAGD